MTDQERFNTAIKFAVDRHSTQCRKGSKKPYILHPLEALTILNAVGADMNLMIAGVLHDTVEDTDATVEEIETLFGTDVANLVASHSEDKTKSWDERKTTAINELRGADRRLALLIMSDKLSNLRSMQRDYHALGDILWQRFNAPWEKQAWYYGGIVDALKPMAEDPLAGPFYRELTTLYEELFEHSPSNTKGDTAYVAD